MQLLTTHSELWRLRLYLASHGAQAGGWDPAGFGHVMSLLDGNFALANLGALQQEVLLSRVFLCLGKRRWLCSASMGLGTASSSHQALCHSSCLRPAPVAGGMQGKLASNKRILFRKWAWVAFFFGATETKTWKLIKIFWLIDTAKLHLKQSVQSIFRKSFSSRQPSLLMQSWERNGGHRDMPASKPPALSHGRALPFASSLCNAYTGLVTAHLAAEIPHHEFFPERIFTSLTNPSA